MTVAALYDIHGNAPALAAVIDELRADPPDAVVIGGDVIAGPLPLETLELLRGLPWPVHWLRGNADRAVVMSFDGTVPPKLLEHPLYQADQWVATFIDRAERDFQDIEFLATESGSKAILDEGRTRGEDLAARFSSLDGFCEHAFWTFLERNQYWRGALAHAHRRGVGGDEHDAERD